MSVSAPSMVWAGIRHGGRKVVVHLAGALTGIRYREEIHQHHVIPYMNVNGGMFQYARLDHVLHVLIGSFCNTPMVQTLSWNTHSLDLKPIEHQWDALDQRVFRRKLPS